jgi:hypothetical protein
LDPKYLWLLRPWYLDTAHTARLLKAKCWKACVMKYVTLFRYLLLAGALCIVAGCKLAVADVEGGHMQSLLNGDCLEGDICTVQPVFKSAPPITDVIAVEGREWAQVDLFSNLSRNDINAVCPEPTGVCIEDGILNDQDMTGWTWASLEDIRALFNFYIGSDVLGPWPGDTYGQDDSIWASAFFAAGWRPSRTSTEPYYRELAGLAIDTAISPSPIMPWIYDAHHRDQANTRTAPATNWAQAYVGGWFYRIPQTITKNNCTSASCGLQY